MLAQEYIGLLVTSSYFQENFKTSNQRFIAPGRFVVRGGNRYLSLVENILRGKNLAFFYHSYLQSYYYQVRSEDFPTPSDRIIVISKLKELLMSLPSNEFRISGELSLLIWLLDPRAYESFKQKSFMN